MFDTVELGREIVEEERVDDLVDVPDGGVVHASLAALVVAEGLLHQRAEDDGADGAPVEPVAGREQGFAYQVGELWNLDAFGEQAAVDVREAFEVVLQILVALVERGVQDVEQVDDGAAQVRGVVAFDVLAERVAGVESGVLGVQAEHEAHGQHGEAVVAFRVVGIVVLRGERVVQVRDEQARVLGQLLLDHDAGMLAAEDRFQGAQVFAEVLQRELVHGCSCGAWILFQVVEAEGFEVARAQHRGLLAQRQGVRVA